MSELRNRIMGRLIEGYNAPKDEKYRPFEKFWYTTVFYRLKNGDKTLHQRNFSFPRSKFKTEKDVVSEVQKFVKTVKRIELDPRYDLGVDSSPNKNYSSLGDGAFAGYNVTVDWNDTSDRNFPGTNKYNIKDVTSSKDAEKKVKTWFEKKFPNKKIRKVYFTGTGY